MTRAGTALLAVLIAGTAGLAEAEVNPFWKELGGSASEKGTSNTPDGRDAFDPSVAVGADGRPVVVYNEGFGGTGGSGSIVVKRWTGSIWQTLSGTAGIGHGRTPQIRISSTGTHYVAWLQDDGEPAEAQVHLLRRTVSGTSWQPLAGSDAAGGVTGLNGSGVRSFSLALTADGNPMVAFEALAQTGVVALDEGIGEGLPQIYVKRYNPSSNAWEYLGSGPLTGGGASNARSVLVQSTTTYAAHFATNPSLAIRSDGTPLVAFVYGTAYDGPSGPAFIPDNTEIFVTQFSNGSGWTALGPAVPQFDDGAAAKGGLGGVSQSSAFSSGPSLATGPLNEVWLAWWDGNNIFARRWSGVSWDELAGSATGDGLSNPGFVNGLPALALTTNRDPVVVWSSQVPGGSSQIFAKQGHDTFTEMGPDSAEQDGISASQSGAVAPMIGAPSAGAAGPAVVWMDRTGVPFEPGQIFLRQFSTVAVQLDVTVVGSGASVTSTPSGIDCPDNSCSELFPGGEVVSLTPVAGPDSIFERWSGACTGSGACIVRMAGPRSVNASFAGAATLSVSTSGSGAASGTVSGARIACGADCEEKYRLGTPVTLTVTMPTGTLFGGWGGDCAFRGRNTSCTLTMTADRSVTAEFTQRVYRLSFAAAVPAGAASRGLVGSVDASANGALTASCLFGSACFVDLDHGTRVVMEASADAGNRFLSWTGGICNGRTSATCAFTLTANGSTSALFRGVTGVRVLKAGNGAGTVSGTGFSCGLDCVDEVFTGTARTLTPAAATGSTFLGWSGDVCAGQASGACTFTAAGLNQSVTATFQLRKQRLAVTTTGAGVVMSSPAGNDCGNGHTPCAFDYDYGTVVSLTPFPDTDNMLAAWTGCTSLNGSVCNVLMTANRSVTARFVAARTLDVSASGNGTGRITAPTTPPVACVGNCSASRLVALGTPVVLTPAPGVGSHFGWTGGDCTGSAACRVVMSQNRTAVGQFMLNRHTLTVTRRFNGSVVSTSALPDPIDCGTGTTDCGSTLDYGTVVGLEARADTGFVFTRWTGTSPCSVGARATNASCSFPLQGNVTATPNFRPRTVVNLGKDGDGAGTITATGTLSPASVSCGPACDGASFQAFDGRAVTLRATPAVGSTFTGFSGACTSNASTCTFTPTGASQDVSASFGRHPRTVNVTVRGEGTVTSDRPGCDAASSSCTVQSLFGDEVTFTAELGDPDHPLSFLVSWTWTGCSSLGGPPIIGRPACVVRLTSPTTAPVSVTVSFSGLLHLSTGGDGTGSVTATPPGAGCVGECGHSYPFGTPVTFTRVVGSGSAFGGWGGDCAFRGTNATCPLTMSRNREVTASFVGPRTLSVTKPGRGTGTVTSSPAGIACGGDCSQTYPYGTVVTLTATVVSGSVFEGFTGCDTTPTATSCRFTMTEDRTVEVVFNPRGGLAVQVIGRGTVVSDDGLINCGLGGTECQVRYEVGKRVVLSTSAAPDSFFDQWFGACPTRESCPVEVFEGVRVVAAIFGSGAVLTISFPGNGAGFVDHAGALPSNGTRCMSGAPCTVFVEPGETVVLTATATAGLFSDWGGDCAGTPRGASCQLVVVGVRSVSATFLADPVTARLLSDQHVAIAANGVPCDQPCDRFFERGTAVTFAALPRPGRIFTGWTGDCASFGNASCVLEMTGNRTVSATVIVERYALTVSVNNDNVEAGGGTSMGLVVVTPSGEFHSCESATSCTTLFTPGDTVTLEATSPDLFTVFGFFGGDCSDQGNPCTLTMDQDRSVEAIFFFTCDPDPLNCGN